MGKSASSRLSRIARATKKLSQNARTCEYLQDFRLGHWIPAFAGMTGTGLLRVLR